MNIFLDLELKCNSKLSLAWEFLESHFQPIITLTISHNKNYEFIILYKNLNHLKKITYCPTNSLFWSDSDI